MITVDLISGASIGLGVWLSVYLSNRVWLMFKGVVS